MINFFYKVKKRLNYFIYNFFRLFPVKNNMIMFNVFQGDYTCNCKAICNFLLKSEKKYFIIWTVKDKTDINQFDNRIKLVREFSLKFYFYLAISRILFDNAIQYQWAGIIKRKKQVIFNTFHGSMGLKRIDSNSQSKKWKKLATSYDDKMNFLVSNSLFENGVYRSLWKKTKILNYGHARNDIFFDENTMLLLKDKVYDFYSLPKNYSIALYAPTFRDNDRSFELPNFEDILNALKKKFSGEWVIIVRFHSHLSNIFYSKGNKILDGNIYPDIQELICASQIGITDYSSWICDQVLTRKPGFIYAPDYELYLKERGFYYPLEDTPFPIAKSNRQLYENIMNFNFENYEIKRKEYLNKLGCCENGHACEKIYSLINDIIFNN